MQSPKLKAGTYSLIKNPIEVKQISAIYRALNKDTNEIWHAKIIDNELIALHNLFECLEFNETVLSQAKTKENVIYVEELFTLAGKTFIIQEEYNETLISAVANQCPMSTDQMENILKDVVTGLYEIYSLGYFTRSLRPEHIVCVDGVWKIQSVVFNSKEYGVDSELCWSSKYASPQEKANKGEIGQSAVDEQLVWYIGMIGIYMIFGDSYGYEEIMNDHDIDWQKVRKSTSDDLYSFLRKCLKVNYEERMRIRELIEDKLFQQVYELSANIFLSESKFYRPKKTAFSNNKNLPSIAIEDQHLLNTLEVDIGRFRYFLEVDKFVQQLPFHNNFDISLLKYLSFTVGAVNLRNIRDEAAKWPKSNDSIQKHKSFKKIINDLNLLINQADQLKQKYYKSIDGVKATQSEVSKLREIIGGETIDQTISYSQVVELYMKIAGSIYTILTKQCQKSDPDESKLRTINYYTLGVYLLHFYDKKDFTSAEAFDKDGIIAPFQLIENGSIHEIIGITQQMIREYFVVRKTD